MHQDGQTDYFTFASRRSSGVLNARGHHQKCLALFLIQQLMPS
jgi:hypothetical protein